MEVTTRGAASLSISLLNLEAILLVVVCCHTSLELRIVFVLNNQWEKRIVDTKKRVPPPKNVER